MDDDLTLLTLAEAAEIMRLSCPESFARFARVHGIPLVRFGQKVVRVRPSDLRAAIEANTGPA